MTDNDTISRPAKGELGGECNRTACDRSPATYYNSSTRKHYCRSCARAINRYADGVELCRDADPFAAVLATLLRPPGSAVAVEFGDGTGPVAVLVRDDGWTGREPVRFESLNGWLGAAAVAAVTRDHHYRTMGRVLGRLGVGPRAGVGA